MKILSAAFKFLRRGDLTQFKVDGYNITPHRCRAFATDGEVDPPAV